MPEKSLRKGLLHKKSGGSERKNCTRLGYDMSDKWREVNKPDHMGPEQVEK